MKTFAIFLAMAAVTSAQYAHFFGTQLGVPSLATASLAANQPTAGVQPAAVPEKQLASLSVAPVANQAAVGAQAAVGGVAAAAPVFAGAFKPINYGPKVYGPGALNQFAIPPNHFTMQRALAVANSMPGALVRVDLNGEIIFTDQFGKEIEPRDAFGRDIEIEI